MARGIEHNDTVRKQFPKDVVLYVKSFFKEVRSYWKNKR